MFIGRLMDKQVVVHIHNGLLLSYKKECIWVSSNKVDETGAYYTEWNKSERKTPIQYINAYMWNLDRWQWRPYMQDSKRDIDVKNRLLDSVGKGEGGMIWENGIERYITICKIDDQCKFNAWSRAHKAGALGQPRGMGWGGSWGAVQDGGTHDMYTHGWFMSMYGKTHHNIVR